MPQGPQQFDVFPNPSSALRARVPFVMVLQSDFASGTAERLVAPLARPMAGEPFAGRLTPMVDVQGQPLAVVLPRITPVNLRLLSGRIANLGQHRHAIVQALDLLFVGV